MEEKQWYYQTWFIVIISIIFPLAGIILVLANPHASKKGKLSAIIVLVPFFFLWFLALQNSPDYQSTTDQAISDTSDEETQTSDTEAVEEEPAEPEMSEEEAIQVVVENLVNETSGEETNNDKQRVRKIEVSPHSVTVNYNADDNLTTGLTRSGTLINAKDILPKIIETDSVIDMVIINAYLPLTDKYGNESSDKVSTIKISRKTVEKINWENFDPDNFPEVADDYWEHPVLK